MCLTGRGDSDRRWKSGPRRDESEHVGHKSPSALINVNLSLNKNVI